MKLFFFFVCTALLLSTGCFFWANSAFQSKNEWSYTVIIDAGSSGSRPRLFMHRLSPQTGLPEIKQAEANNKKIACDWIEPGISSFSKSSDLNKDLKKYFEPVFKCLEAKLSKHTKLSNIDLYMYATAGIRNLEKKTAQDQILKQIQELFRQSKFNYKEVGTITGQQEGLYAWLTINDLLDNLGNNNQTQGIIEMGGASLQIAFQPINSPKKYGVRLKIGQKDYHVYAYSYPNLGFWGGYNNFTKNSRCLLPQSDFNMCQSDIAKHQKFEEKHQDPEHLFHFGLQGVYQPPIFGPFIAFGAIGTMAKDFGLDYIEPEQINNFAKRYICGKSLEQLKRYYPNAEENLAHSCFKLTYLSTLFSGIPSHPQIDGLGFPRYSSQIYATKKIADQDISWPRGLLYYQMLQNKN